MVKQDDMIMFRFCFGSVSVLFRSGFSQVSLCICAQRFFGSVSVSVLLPKQKHIGNFQYITNKHLCKRKQLARSSAFLQGILKVNVGKSDKWTTWIKE